MSAGQAALAILSALPEEQQGLVEQLQQPLVEAHAGRHWVRGNLHGVPVVLALSGIGKVAAAATTALLAERFRVAALLFTGVAGGLGPGVQVGDLVVATQFLQHDLDASPIFPRWEVPGRGLSRFVVRPDWCEALRGAAQSALAAGSPSAASALPPGQGAAVVRVHSGLIVSGDRFVSSQAECRRLQQELPDALAVDMESAAVAQVCHDLGLPLAVVRSISDRADDAAHVDFPQFLAQVAAPLSRAVVLRALPALQGLLSKA